MMRYFLDTVETIPDGVGFSHFDGLHLAWLTGFLLFAIFSCAYYRRHPEHRTRIRRGFALAILADEVFLMAGLLMGGNFRANYLPLELCSINVFLILWHAWHPGELLDNFLYAVCLPGAVLALLFPDWVNMPLGNFLHIHSFTLHILLAVYPMMLTFSGEIRPEIRVLPRCLALLMALATVALGFNLVLGTNFMFLMYAPPGNPLGWFREHWGSHLLGFPVFLAAVVAVMYGPILLHRSQRTP